MSHAEHDAPDTFRLQQAQLMHGERLAIHLKQRLRHSLSDWPQACSEAPGENRNCQSRIQEGILLRMRHHRGTSKVKLHTDFTESRTSHDRSQASLLFRVEHE